MSSRNAPHVCNIGEPGARRRRRTAYVWIAATIVVAVALTGFGAPRWTRLAIVLPVGLAAAGFLQARERT